MDDREQRGCHSGESRDGVSVPCSGIVLHAEGPSVFFAPPCCDDEPGHSLPLVGLGVFLAEKLHRFSAAYQFADAALQDLDNVPADIAPVYFTFLSHIGHLRQEASSA